MAEKELRRYLAAALAFLLLVPWCLGGPDLSIRSFDLPPGDAQATLPIFAAQAGASQRLLYSVDSIRGITTNAVVGQFTALGALERMFAGTPVRTVEDMETGALALVRTSERPSERPPVVGPIQIGPPSDLPTDSLENDRIVTLTPFEVKTDPDNSYGSLQSNTLTAFSMDLEKMPAGAETFNEAFINDTGSLTIESMLINYSGVVGYTPGDTSAYAESPGDRDGGGGLSIRGFGSTPIRFDGFFGPPTGVRSNSGMTPLFAVERVDVIEGPQSLLYGAIGAGGVINAVSKRARFDVTDGSLQYGVSDLGSKYGILDVNTGDDWVAVRFAATNQDQATERQNLGYSMEGYYGQIALQLGSSTVVRILRGKYETDATNGFNPSLKPFLPADSPVANDTTQYLAVTNQIPAGVFGGAVNWDNIDSFAGSWGAEPITNAYNSMIVESSPLPWLAAKLNVIYNTMTDWRNTTGLTLEPVGVGGNPYPVPAIELANPNLNFQSQRQKGVQLNLVATGEFFNGAARSQTLLGGYLNHVGPSYGSSGITYAYIEADSNWAPIVTSGATDYGHILMPDQWIPIMDGQIDRYPVFQPGASRVTLDGQNYILEPRIAQQASAVGTYLPGNPTNPLGVVPNNGAGGFFGNFNPGVNEHEHFLDLANTTDWLGGRLTTLAGFSFDRATTVNAGAGSTTVLPWTTYLGYEMGAIYQAAPWLGVYATIGTAATPGGTTSDLDGNPLATPDARSPIPELGLKAHTRDQRFGAQLSWDVATQDADEPQSVDGSYLNAVNPNGINGRFGNGAANSFVDVDRKATSLEFTATANPLAQWRIRAGASYLFARVLDGVAYRQLYNDQFHTNGSGQVTFQNGSVVYVNGAATDATTAAVTTADSAGAAPLTLSMINDPNSPYYAMPDPTSGSVTNAALKSILTGGSTLGASQISANGPIATGVTGLPLSQAQYSFASPFAGNTVTVFPAGSITTGYPGWQWNFESDYTIASGSFRGLGIYVDGTAQYSTRAFYTFYPSANAALGTEATNPVNEARVLYVLPTIARFDAGIHYTRRCFGLRNTVRLMVNNVFNHDPFYILPQASDGLFLQTTQRTPPRLWGMIDQVDF